MQTKISLDNQIAVLKLSGRFDFNAHRDFRSAYEPLVDNKDVETLRIDLNEVDYLDSSALGMLLMLRDKASAANTKIILANPQASVRQVLDIANFKKLFEIV